MKESLNSKKQIYFNFLFINISPLQIDCWIRGNRSPSPAFMVLKVCTTEYSVLERMMKAYINFPLKKILQIKHIKQNSFVSPQKKSSQRFISSSVSASAHSGSPELLYLVIKLVVYQCLCPCMFISFSLLGSSCSSLVACPTSLLENAQPDHPPS